MPLLLDNGRSLLSRALPVGSRGFWDVEGGVDHSGSLVHPMEPASRPVRCQIPYKQGGVLEAEDAPDDVGSVLQCQSHLARGLGGEPFDLWLNGELLFIDTLTSSPGG